MGTVVDARLTIDGSTKELGLERATVGIGALSQMTKGPLNANVSPPVIAAGV